MRCDRGRFTRRGPWPTSSKDSEPRPLLATYALVSEMLRHQHLSVPSLRRGSLAILLGVFLTALSAHAGEKVSYRDFLARNLTNSSRLSLGMTKESVAEIMGGLETETRDGPIYNPWSREAFKRGEDTIEVLYYLVRRNPPFTPILKSQATSVVFKNGELVAWGRGADASFR